MIQLNTGGWDLMLIDTLIGILVVFGVLALLVVIFLILQTLNVRAARKKMAKATGKKEEEIIVEDDISADEIAAVSMALYLFMNDWHDNESNILTIKKIERRYSPWSSKIYGLTNINR